MSGSLASSSDRTGLDEARGTPAQRLRARSVAAAAWIACHLPEGPLLAAADAAGSLAFRLAPARRRRASANLHRVAAWLDREGLGDPAARAAANDPRALDRLVRDAFRHHARYWVELVRAPVMNERYIRERVMVETPEALEAALAARPVVFVGLHFGAIELPGYYAWNIGGRRGVGPMERVADPELQRWFTSVRGALGMRLVDLREARRELGAAMERGELVGLVADRDISGGGAIVPLFGHEAPLPLGPALLLLEHPAPAYCVTVRRVGRGRYAGRIEPLPEPPADGTRRERALAFLRAEAQVFEGMIAAAPEQWWAVFHPIWPDLEASATRRSRR